MRTTRQKLMACCDCAFSIGQTDENKQMTQEQLFKKVWVPSLRNGYEKAVWEAYKAGRFAQECGD